MKTTSQESVKNLFNLPANEKVYDDFGCAYSDVILYHGRLFLTENFICFNSNILGLKNKYVIPLKDVKEIKKRKTLGIFNNSIEIKAYNETKKQDSTYVFTSFASRNIAYKRIKMVWKAYMRMNASKLGKSDGASLNSKPVQYASDSESNSSEEEAEINLNGLNKSNMSEYSISLESELGDNGNKEEIYFPPVDPDKVYECSKLEVKLSQQEFYEKFISDNAEMSNAKFYQDIMGHVNVNATEWKDVEGSPGVHIRDINFMMKVKDVPFISQTRVHKAQKFKKEPLEKGGEKYLLVGNSTSLDVPYSSYFYHEDTWEILPYSADKCVVRTSICVNFTKSTMFKSKIEKKTREEFKKEIDKWCEFITSKGIAYEVYNPGAKKQAKSGGKEEEILLHGVEKIDGDGLSELRKKFSPITKFIFTAHTHAKNFYHSNPKEFFIYLFLIILTVLILYALLQLKLCKNRLDVQLEYMKEIKYLLETRGGDLKMKEGLPNLNIHRKDDL